MRRFLFDLLSRKAHVAVRFGFPFYEANRLVQSSLISVSLCLCLMSLITLFSSVSLQLVRVHPDFRVIALGLPVPR